LDREIRKRVENMPVLSAVVMEVLSRSGRPDCSTREVAEVIAADNSLTSKVLRLANSAYYGLPRRVERVSMAVPLLGLRAVRKLVLGVSTYDLMQLELEGYGHRKETLWAHSLGVSIAAERLCGMVGYRKTEELSLIALMHDIGKVVLSGFILDRFDENTAPVLERGGWEAVRLERRLCGTDHAEVGAMIAERWNLSPRFAEVIRYHHRPENAPGMPKASALVNLADTIARVLLGDEDPVQVLLNLDQASMRVLHVKGIVIARELSSIKEAIRGELDFWIRYAGPRREEDDGAGRGKEEGASTSAREEALEVGDEDGGDEA
jgi:putative nucleotidyltransferase with HDIG domain